MRGGKKGDFPANSVLSSAKFHWVKKHRVPELTFTSALMCHSLSKGALLEQQARCSPRCRAPSTVALQAPAPDEAWSAQPSWKMSDMSKRQKSLTSFHLRVLEIFCFGPRPGQFLAEFVSLCSAVMQHTAVKDSGMLGSGSLAFLHFLSELKPGLYLVFGTVSKSSPSQCCFMLRCS